MASASPAARQESASYCKRRLSASVIRRLEAPPRPESPRSATTDALELHLNQVEKPATQRRVEVRQLDVGDVVDRVDRRSDPLKPAIAGSRTWALRINGSGRDQLAKGGNESVGALHLLPRFLIGHWLQGVSKVRGKAPLISQYNRTPWL